MKASASARCLASQRRGLQPANRALGAAWKFLLAAPLICGVENHHQGVSRAGIGEREMRMRLCFNARLRRHRISVIEIEIV